MTRKLVWFALTAPLAVWAQGKAAEKLARPAPGVNWEGQVVRATGGGAPDLKAANPAAARLGAERAAQMDAFRKLLEQVKGVHISAGRTVGDEMAKDEVRGQVEGVVRGFKVTGKRYFSDSGVEVDVEVPLAALTELFVQSGEEAVAVNKEGDKTNTGLVVDARGLKVTPALAVRLVDEAGKLVYGVEMLSTEARKSSAVAVFVKGLAEAKRSVKVGDKPLVVKAARVQGSDLVLGAGEVKKLSQTNNTFLAEGRVVVVTQ
ncbi:MAG: LPP20 family lipoprotein [Myxococcota bacterium]